MLTGSEEEGAVNDSINLRIGASEGGDGELIMTGGYLTVACQKGGNNVFTVGEGSGSKGVVELSGDAMISLSNFVAIARSSASTGIVTIAGSAIMRLDRSGTRFQLGIERDSLGVVNVRENGSLELIGQDGLNIGGYAPESCGILNVEGGQVVAQAGITVCRATEGVTTGYGEINLSGGMIHNSGGASYGLVLGRSEGSKSQAFASAKGNISGGLLSIPSSVWVSASQQNGIILAETRHQAGNAAYAELNITDGIVTNARLFTIGSGLNGTGVVYQTGGAVYQGYGNAGVGKQMMTVGWGGGVHNARRCICGGGYHSGWQW